MVVVYPVHLNPNVQSTVMAMLGGALGPILCGVLNSIDPRAPILIGGLIYFVLTLHVTALARRAGPAVDIAAAPAGENRA